MIFVSFKIEMYKQERKKVNDTLLWHLSKENKKILFQLKALPYSTSQTIHQGQDWLPLGGLYPPQRGEKGKLGLFLLSLVSIRRSKGSEVVSLFLWVWLLTAGTDPTNPNLGVRLQENMGFFPITLWQWP